MVGFVDRVRRGPLDHLGKSMAEGQGGGKCAEGAHGWKSKVFRGFWVNLLRLKAKIGSRGDG